MSNPPIKANIGISEAHLEEEAAMLNVILSDEFVLYTKVRRCHWNVTGIHFNDLHKFFEELYEELEELVDEVAERVRALGHHAYGTLKDFLNATHLLETTDTSNAPSMLRDVLNDYETIIRLLRENIVTAHEKFKDDGTGDFLTQLMEKHEKRAWMLRSLCA